MNEDAAESNTLKAISSTDDELRVGNYIILFGGRDLSAFEGVGSSRRLYKNRDGSAGEFFSKRTQLESDYTAIGRLAVDWEHGGEEQGEGLGPDDVLGYVDWSTKRVDDRGVWVERVLNRRNQYVKWVAELIQSGLVGSSSQAVHGRSRRTAGGEIVEWPLYRDTLTVSPAEPRMVTENAVAAMKALGIDPQSITTDASAENDTEQNSDVSPDAGGDPKQKPEQDNSKGLTEMTPEEIAAMVAAAMDKRDAERKTHEETEAKRKADMDQAIKDAVAAERKVWEAEAKRTRRGSYATGGDDEQDGGRFDLAALQKSTKYLDRVAFWRSTQANRDVAKAIKGYMRYEIEPGELQDALKADLKASNNTDMNIGTPADGGYAVPTGHYQGIIARCSESAVDEKLGVMHIPGKGTTVNVPVEAGAANEFILTAEAAAFDRDAPVLGQGVMTLLKYTKDIELSVELLEDEDSKLMAFLDNWVGRALARTKNHLLVTALAAGATATPLGGAATIAGSDVPGLTYALQDCYADNAKWLMRRATEGVIRSLTGNPYQFFPTPAGGPNTIWNSDVYHSEFVAAPAASAKSVYFGDFSYVGVRDGGLTFLRDPYSKASTGQLVLHYYTRTVYKVLQAEAILAGTQTSA